MICERCTDTRFHPHDQHPDCDCDCNAERDAWGVPEGWIGAPKPFTGSANQLRANMMTHLFDRDGRCSDCDVRRGGLASAYPCMTRVPRVLIRQGTATAEAAVMTPVLAAGLADAIREHSLDEINKWLDANEPEGADHE